MPDALRDRRAFLKLGAALCPEALAAQQLSQRPVPRRDQPNIVLIYADDLGYGDLGCYGSRIDTPNLDGMARQGVLFRQFCSASPVCSPARAALLTGRYPTRVDVPDVLQPDSTTGLRLSETTLANSLRTGGYSTACIGKWHLGSLEKFLPMQRGFDQFYGLPYSHDMAPLPLMQNGTTVEQSANPGTLTQRFTEQAVSFIGRSRSNPFFLYLPHPLPHIPLAASPAFRGKSGFGLYADAVQEIDWSVGEVLRALQNNGIDDNTLVMFSSDHGPWFEGSAGRLRGRKGETWEGGVRVPFIARLPRRIPSGRVAAGFASTLDILPTIARLCGAPLPSSPLDGTDIWPLMTGQRESIDRDAFLYFDSWHLQAARLGPWKLHVSRYNTPPWITIPSGWRQNVALSHPELYNLDSDPEECYDAAAERPDIVAAILARMTAMLPTFPEPVQSLWKSVMTSGGRYCPSGGWPNK